MPPPVEPQVPLCRATQLMKVQGFRQWVSCVLPIHIILAQILDPNANILFHNIEFACSKLVGDKQLGCH